MSSQTFHHEVQIEAPAAEVFAFFERPDAFELLSPPWASVEVLEQKGTIRNGDGKTLQIALGPLKQKWQLEHCDYKQGEQFKDVQVAGPFRAWAHTHRVEPVSENACLVVDDIEYQMPGGMLGRMVGGGYMERELAKLFTYRTEVLQQHFQQDDTTEA